MSPQAKAETTMPRGTTYWHNKTLLESYRQTSCTHFAYPQATGQKRDGSETEGAGQERPPQVDIETKRAFASGNTEIEAAIAEVQVPGWAEGIIDRAEDLPIGMGPDPKAADIAIGGQPEAVAKLAVIAPADQRIRPAGAALRGGPSEQAGSELHSGGEPPGAKTDAGIGELHRVLDHPVEGDPGARIRSQLGIAAPIKDVMGRDPRADRQMDGVHEKPDLSVANFPRSHERGPVEMRQKIVEAHIGVHFGAALQRRRRRHVDTRHPQIGRHKELISAGGGHLLCGGGVEHSRKCSDTPEYREKEPLRLMHSALLRRHLSGN